MPRATKKSYSARALRDTAQKFKILSDQRRLCILGAIADGEANVVSLATLLGMSEPGISHHLSLLRVATFIEKRRDGPRVIYALTDLGRVFWELAAKVISCPDHGRE